MEQDRIKLHASWKERLKSEFDQPYMNDLKTFLVKEIQTGKTIYPKGDEYFAALNQTTFKDVKVVIIGQDPYHGPGQAHGLCFSVKKDIPPPPSLVNIFKELNRDLGIAIPNHGYLEHWAGQGVLLLNSVLTVEKHKAAAHKDRGWERFTDAIIATLNEERENIAFVLWGSYAQRKGQYIDANRHLVLKAPHPSPLSAHRGFFGSSPFSKINRYLAENGQHEINWEIPPIH